MKSKVIEEALSGFREVLFSEIAQKLKSSKERRVKMNLSLPCSIDEERYNHNHIKAIYLGLNDRVMVEYTDDWDNEVFNDEIDLFTVDEILEIFNTI